MGTGNGRVSQGLAGPFSKTQVYAAYAYSSLPIATSAPCRTCSRTEHATTSARPATPSVSLGDVPLAEALYGLDKMIGGPAGHHVGA